MERDGDEKNSVGHTKSSGAPMVIRFHPINTILTAWLVLHERGCESGGGRKRVRASSVTNLEVGRIVALPLSFSIDIKLHSNIQTIKQVSGFVHGNTSATSLKKFKAWAWHHLYPDLSKFPVSSGRNFGAQ